MRRRRFKGNYPTPHSVEDNPESVARATPFAPMDWQEAPWKSKSPILLLTGSAGGGKSHLACHKLHGFAMKYPGATCLIVRKVRASLANSTILFFTTTVLNLHPAVRHFPSKARLIYPNGSVVIYLGIQDATQRRRLRSIGLRGTVDYAWLEEATEFHEDDFNAVAARMRGRAAPWTQIIVTTNPDTEYHWINKRLIAGGEADVHLSSAEDNDLTTDDYRRWLNRLTGIEGERLRDGRWCSTHGLIFPEWRTEHFCAPFEIPKHWIVEAGVDWGFTRPGAIGIIAYDEDDRAFLVHEVHQTGKLVSWWKEQALELGKRFRVQRWWCDPSEPANIAEFRNAGLNAHPAKNDVLPGIDTLHERLKRRDDDRMSFGFYVFRGSLANPDEKLIKEGSPVGFAQEIAAYKHASIGGVTSDFPVKEHDHAIDAVRYAVHSRKRRGFGGNGLIVVPSLEIVDDVWTRSF